MGLCLSFWFPPRYEATAPPPKLRSLSLQAVDLSVLAPQEKGHDSLDDGLECGLCLSVFASLNASSCCQGQVCTECYLALISQGKAKHLCPFCMHEDFRVMQKKVSSGNASHSAGAGAAVSPTIAAPISQPQAPAAPGLPQVDSPAVSRTPSADASSSTPGSAMRMASVEDRARLERDIAKSRADDLNAAMLAASTPSPARRLPGLRMYALPPSGRGGGGLRSLHDR